MAKVKSKWICQNCGYESAGYLGKCPECGSWGSFTEEIKNQVRELIKEVTQEDKENLKKILLAHYQQKKDLVKVKKQKEQEINEFIESLC